MIRSAKSIQIQPIIADLINKMNIAKKTWSCPLWPIASDCTCSSYELHRHAPLLCSRVASAMAAPSGETALQRETRLTGKNRKNTLIGHQSPLINPYILIVKFLINICGSSYQIFHIYAKLIFVATLVYLFESLFNTLRFCLTFLVFV